VGTTKDIGVGLAASACGDAEAESQAQPTLRGGIALPPSRSAYPRQASLSLSPRLEPLSGQVPDALRAPARSSAIGGGGSGGGRLASREETETRVQ